MNDAVKLLPSALDRLLAGEDLDPATVEALFGALFDGALTHAQIAALVVALRSKGESADEIAAAASALRSRMRRVEVRSRDAAVLDTCGTGGDGAATFNVSTAVAIVCAACDVTVAKHGNRAVSSRSGSADILEALGIAIEPRAPDDAEAFDRRLGEGLEHERIAFLFAPRHHGALAHAAIVRRELGVRTVFNLLGPLANPASATHQLLGVFDDRRRRTFAEVLRTLGVARAWVVCGLPSEGAPRGIDEVSPSGVTRVTELRDGAIVEQEIHPSDAGLAPVDIGALRGGDARQNAATLLRLLAGERDEIDGVRTAVVLNAAAALVVSGRASGLREGRARAEEAIDSGAANRRLDAWRARMAGP